MINPELEFATARIKPYQEASPETAPDISSWRASWVVPASLSYFEGHFPGMPVLPAFAVIDLTIEAIRRSGAAGHQPRLGELKNAKFTAPIVPGVPLEITLVLNQGSAVTGIVGDGNWRAQWRSGQELLADLSLRLRGGDAVD